MMKTIGLLAGALLLASTVQAATDTSPPAPNWMAGAWIETKGDRWTDEYWTTMRAGIMIGAGRSGNGETLLAWEATRIVRNPDGTLTFWASPKGSKAVPFRMISGGENEIVFESKANDYPQRVRYWREGKSLKAEISLADGSKAMRWSYSPIGGN